MHNQVKSTQLTRSVIWIQAVFFSWILKGRRHATLLLAGTTVIIAQLEI